MHIYKGKVMEDGSLCLLVAMAAVASNSVWEKVTWNGTKTKKAIKDLHIIGTIFRTGVTIENTVHKKKKPRAPLIPKSGKNRMACGHSSKIRTCWYTLIITQP